VSDIDPEEAEGVGLEVGAPAAIHCCDGAKNRLPRNGRMRTCNAHRTAETVRWAQSNA